MTDLVKLRPYQAVAVIGLAERSSGVYREAIWAEGQAILSTVFVQSCDPGASVRVRYVDQSLGDANYNALDLGSHEVITENLTSNKKLITRFHSQPSVVAEVVGGSATFGVFISLVDATKDGDFTFGKTLTLVGTVTNTQQLFPAQVGNAVQSLSVRCSGDQTTSNRLLFSLDGGQNFITLSPGEAFSVAPRGILRQIMLKAKAATTAYELVLNTIP